MQHARAATPPPHLPTCQPSPCTAAGGGLLRVGPLSVRRCRWRMWYSHTRAALPPCRRPGGRMGHPRPRSRSPDLLSSLKARNPKPRPGCPACCARGLCSAGDRPPYSGAPRSRCHSSRLGNAQLRPLHRLQHLQAPSARAQRCPSTAFQPGPAQTLQVHQGAVPGSGGPPAAGRRATGILGRREPTTRPPLAMQRLARPAARSYGPGTHTCWPLNNATAIPPVRPPPPLPPHALI